MASPRAASDAAQPPASSAPAPAALTVAQVVTRIRQLIERQFPGAVWVEGEVSNCTYHQSGHIYLSLVDEQVTDRFGQRLVLPCAFFRGANQSLKFTLTDGLKVLCLGQVTTYEGRGQYQLRVLRVEPKGVGALQLAFEQLKARLQAEGLFDPARKRVIPQWPARVALVTSPTGSAVHDMVSTLRAHVHVILVPVKVQGEGAAAEIAEGIRTANRLQLADVLIVGRGGGSVEDLWAFNEEAVARAIVASAIPVISAVGHQDDWTIADFTADLRASTPTDAAKQLVHARGQLMQETDEAVRRLVDGMRAVLEEAGYRLDTLQHRLRLLHPLNQLERYRARAQELDGQLASRMRFALEGLERHLEGLAGRLHALSPLAVLARGYSITRRRGDGRVITDARRLVPGQELDTLVARGRILSRVLSTERQDMRHET